MVPLLLAVAGVFALFASVGIQRGFGNRARVGRLLAVAPHVSVAEARRLAESGAQDYVRIDGRIDSDQEFEDEAHRPLVLRRTTIQWRPAPAAGSRSGNDSWRLAGDPSIESVPFVVREGLDEIAVDAAALAEGLVVIPRTSLGKVADLGDLAPDGITGDADARLVVEQVSTVEHATALGVPTRGGDGRIAMGPGLGRPLILTTLERDEAMRVLTGGAARRASLALACLIAGGALLVVAGLWFVADSLIGGAATALAASPEPSLRPGTDTRTTGTGPGIVGAPVLALLVVLCIAALSVAASLAYVRFTGGPRRSQRQQRPRPR